MVGGHRSVAPDHVVRVGAPTSRYLLGCVALACRAVAAADAELNITSTPAPTAGASNGALSALTKTLIAFAVFLVLTLAGLGYCCYRHAQAKAEERKTQAEFEASFRCAEQRPKDDELVQEYVEMDGAASRTVESETCALTRLTTSSSSMRSTAGRLPETGRMREQSARLSSSITAGDGVEVRPAIRPQQYNGRKKREGSAPPSSDVSSLLPPRPGSPRIGGSGSTSHSGSGCSEAALCTPKRRGPAHLIPLSDIRSQASDRSEFGPLTVAALNRDSDCGRSDATSTLLENRQLRSSFRRQARCGGSGSSVGAAGAEQAVTPRTHRVTFKDSKPGPLLGPTQMRRGRAGTRVGGSGSSCASHNEL